MRADRQRADQERQRSDEQRQRSDEQRQRSDEAWREERRQSDEQRQRADEAWREERRQSDEAWRQERQRLDESWRKERQQSAARFEHMMRDFRQDSARREAATQKAFKDIRAVGLSIVKTLNHHTRILERIERKLSARGNGRPGQNGGGTSPRR
jgi:hypothetical protein